VPDSVEFYPGGPKVVRSFGPPPILYPAPGSQVDPSMALPSKTPEEHDREVLRHLDGAKWVRMETIDGKVTWLPASPEDQAMLDAFRAARNGPRTLPPLQPMPPRPVADAPRPKRRNVLERVVALIQNLIGKSS
jgi:hypothetical protein